jgi:hypothetical protein
MVSNRVGKGLEDGQKEVRNDIDLGLDNCELKKIYIYIYIYQKIQSFKLTYIKTVCNFHFSFLKMYIIIINDDGLLALR